MISAEAKPDTGLLSLIPSVDALLRSETAGRLLVGCGDRRLATLAKKVASDLRTEIIAGASGANWATREEILAEMEQRLEGAWTTERRSGQRRVINATGVIIHTNLGRAPLSDAAKNAIIDAAGYCTLEYDLETGKRGKRGNRAEKLLAELTGAEAALIVNNCAAAAYLVLTVLASGGEAIISRGELVEIGGDFRVPDVLEQSGTALREVGTTNRTKLKDYEKAITGNTRLILKVHPSNYRIVGFTAAPALRELAELAHSRGLPLYEDAGSGALIDLSKYGLSDEPVISRSIADGADLVTFSGDKLLGGCQSGLIVGRKDVIDGLRKHPLYRVLRAGKLAYAILEATLDAYRREAALEDIPVIRMLSKTKEEIAERVRNFVSKLEGSGLHVEIVDGRSAIGGGAAPDVQPETTLIALGAPGKTADELEEKLRSGEIRVIARIEDDRVVIDLRTVSESEEGDLLRGLAGI
jgi:L-seryl-tRNA(Ser) seleniumtransferase